jgi:hypothetical protein
MANKMISEEDLRDDFLSAMVRSEEPLRAPEGFMDGIMSHISKVPAVSTIKPYQPPIWLKWGIPGTIISLLIAALIWAPEKNTSQTDKGLSAVTEAFNSMSSWFSGLHLNIDFPQLNIPSTITWIIGGGILLTWGFLFLNRFLEKMARRDR